MSTESLSTDDSHRALRPPQFSLRTLWAMFTLACVVCGVMVWLGPLPSIVLAMALAMVIAHVAGNSLGTRLRDGANGADRAGPRVIRRDAKAVPLARLPAGCLHDNSAPGWPSLVAAALGGLAGGATGAAALAVGVEGINLGGILVGFFSTALVGCYLCLLVSSFFTITRRAGREAAREHAPAPYRSTR